MKESKAEFQKALDCMLFEGVDSCWAELFLQQNGQSRCFAKGEEIYSPAHYSKSLGILLRGKAVVERDQVLLNQLSAGECFGVAALFVQREQYVTTVRARTDCKAASAGKSAGISQLHPLSVRQNPVSEPKDCQLYRTQCRADAAVLPSSAATAAV